MFVTEAMKQKLIVVIELTGIVKAKCVLSENVFIRNVLLNSYK